jgi:hypothetical protein
MRMFAEGSTNMDSTGQVEPADESELDLNASRPFNQRIELSLLDEDGEGGGSTGYPEESSMMMQDQDDGELTRDKVKRASHQILLAVDRKKRKPKKATSKKN